MEIDKAGGCWVGVGLLGGSGVGLLGGSGVGLLGGSGVAGWEWGWVAGWEWGTLLHCRAARQLVDWVIGGLVCRSIGR